MKKKESGNLSMKDKTFEIDMILIKSDKYDFTIKNPRDEDGWADASDDFVERVGQNDDIFDTWSLIDEFSNSKYLGTIRTMCGSYEKGYDVEIIWFEVTTEDYKTYHVEFELYEGHPYADFKKKVLESLIS